MSRYVHFRTLFRSFRRRFDRSDVRFVRFIDLFRAGDDSWYFVTAFYYIIKSCPIAFVRRESVTGRRTRRRRRFSRAPKGAVLTRNGGVFRRNGWVHVKCPVAVSSRVLIVLCGVFASSPTLIIFYTVARRRFRGRRHRPERPEDTRRHFRAKSREFVTSYAPSFTQGVHGCSFSG